jgi:hypothetical protein
LAWEWGFALCSTHSRRLLIAEHEAGRGHARCRHRPAPKTPPAKRHRQQRDPASEGRLGCRSLAEQEKYRRAATLMPPAAVALLAAPAEAVTLGISAPVPARTMPAAAVPAVAASTPTVLHLLDGGKAIERGAHAARRDRGTALPAIDSEPPTATAAINAIFE